jgi:hypothetical protein
MCECAADNMRNEAQRFKKSAGDLKKQQWWKNMKVLNNKKTEVPASAAPPCAAVLGRASHGC